MARTQRLLVAMATMVLAGGGVITGPQSAAAPAGEVAVAASGHGTATPRFIDQRTNPPAANQVDAPEAARPALGINGKPTGSRLPASTTKGAKPAGSAGTTAAGGANSSPSPQPRIPAPTTVNANFAGINQTAGGGADPSDINASVGPTQILETVNQRVTVFNKTGGQVCTNTLAGWLGQPAATFVFDPRTVYDNLNNRFVIIATTDGVAGQAPRMFLAASQTSNACGGYFIYTLTFNGGLYPVGALLDYPMLGQDRGAILVSTNNFNPNYINSAAWSVSKAQVYAGAAVNFSAFAVAFSTEPVTVTGIPIGATTNTFLVAGRPGFGYNLYRMNNTAGPGTTLVLQAQIASNYAAPPRRVNQCGTATTLDPLDGRIVWAPVQAANSTFVWFTHGNAIGNFPGVRWGAINTATNTVQVANAFHSGTSDDFNPSLGAFEVAANSLNIWLNWAYTDTGATPCANTSTTVNGVAPGGGIPALIATDLTLVTGSNTANTRFGDYSSVHVDPVAASGTCPAGSTALVAQQYFVGGSWATRLARVSFGPGC